MFEWQNHNKVDHPRFFMERMVELSSLFNCLSGATWKKNSIYSLCHNSTPILCHLNVQGILWSKLWMYVIVCLIFFYWKTILITGHFCMYHLIWVNFSTVRQVLIHFVLNVCFPSNHILQIILAFSKREMSWLCWILKKWKLLGYCMNLLLDLLNFEWKKNMCLYNACIY